MTDFVKEMTDVWNHEGVQEAYDRGKALLETIADEIRSLQGQRTTITALMQHLEASGGAEHASTRTARKCESARPSTGDSGSGGSGPGVHVGRVLGYCPECSRRTTTTQPEPRSPATTRSYRNCTVAVRVLPQGCAKHLSVRRTPASAIQKVEKRRGPAVQAQPRRHSPKPPKRLSSQEG